MFGTAVFGSVIAASMTSALGTTLAALHLPVDVAARIAAALHHGGLWVLSGTARSYGLPAGTLRVSLDAGFVIGKHRAATVAALLLALGSGFALRAFARRGTSVTTETGTRPVAHRLHLTLTLTARTRPRERVCHPSPSIRSTRPPPTSRAAAL